MRAIELLDYRIIIKNGIRRKYGKDHFLESRFYNYSETNDTVKAKSSKIALSPIDSKNFLEPYLMLKSVRSIVMFALAVTLPPFTALSAGKVIDLVIPLTVKLPVTWFPATLVMTKEAVGNFSTSKKSPEVMCPMNFWL